MIMQSLKTSDCS